MLSQSAMLVFLSALVATANGSGHEFLSAKRKVSSAAAKAELNGVLDEVLGQGHGLADARLSKIHRTLDPLFRALPKNHLGYISAPVMRYAVRRYFSQTHGWIVKGFNAYDEHVDTSAVGDSDILQDRLPGYSLALLEERFAQQGFSLDAVVALVATLERMAFQEVVRGVELAFQFNDIDRNRPVSTKDLFEIVSSFLIVEMLEGTEDKEDHKREKKEIDERYPHWGTTFLLLQDTIGSDMFQRQATSNPFTNKDVHSFEDAARICEHISEEFGAWSNHECDEMKDMLTEMDVHGTGRVKMSNFYSYNKDGAWQFNENSGLLRQNGVLDESSTWSGPQVLIANYINSLTNCITSHETNYYQICCLNECDLVFQHLESRLAAPNAPASEIIDALESGIHMPTSISELHRERLADIARLNDGQIPIYGRLFARWLHFVYPGECPYPHAEGVVKPMNRREWKELMGPESESETDAKIQKHLKSHFAHREPSPDAGARMWNFEESLLLSSTPSHEEASSIGIGALLRIVVQIGVLAGFLSLFRPLTQMLRSNAKEKVIRCTV